LHELIEIYTRFPFHFLRTIWTVSLCPVTISLGKKWRPNIKAQSISSNYWRAWHYNKSISVLLESKCEFHRLRLRSLW